MLGPQTTGPRDMLQPQKKRSSLQHQPRFTRSPPGASSEKSETAIPPSSVMRKYLILAQKEKWLEGGGSTSGYGSGYGSWDESAIEDTMAETEDLGSLPGPHLYHGHPAVNNGLSAVSNNRPAAQSQHTAAQTQVHALIDPDDDQDPQEREEEEHLQHFRELRMRLTIERQEEVRLENERSMLSKNQQLQQQKQPSPSSKMTGKQLTQQRRHRHLEQQELNRFNMQTLLGRCLHAFRQFIANNECFVNAIAFVPLMLMGLYIYFIEDKPLINIK